MWEAYGSFSSGGAVGILGSRCCFAYGRESFTSVNRCVLDVTIHQLYVSSMSL